MNMNDCPHEDGIMFYDVVANWHTNGEHWHALQAQCETCEQRAIFIEVLDKDEDEFRYVTEGWL